ncbi:tautomerase family protein [Pseudoalteromonas sp. SMS1]|uniref:tautomerase family protein n=1 Tax=Pseudoalteromonas sp. SMS1 TaxID=2908894 RepID=UPI001F3A0DE1|nr:tautomerase family protein [Pseudoalteromonas sp. SMS1]MCF2859494.1 tautomerase family protein [Pseudoalteromonas sp. SMS1]
MMVIIYGIAEHLNPIKARLSDVIQATVTQVIGLPEDKRAHRFVPMSAADFYYPSGRTEAYTVIEINMMEGRKVDTKKALIKALFENIDVELGITPIDLEITIKEQPAHCWGFRGTTGDEAQGLNYKVNV